MRKTIAEIYPTVPLEQPMTQQAQFDKSYQQQRMFAALGGFFGVLAALLVATGLYGTHSFRVNRRKAEIGIRMALGATPQPSAADGDARESLGAGLRPGRRAFRSRCSLCARSSRCSTRFRHSIRWHLLWPSEFWCWYQAALRLRRQGGPPLLTRCARCEPNDR